MATLRALHLTDEPAAWAALGFAVGGGACAVGPVTLRLGRRGAATGIAAWEVGGIGASELDGLPLASEEPASPPATQPNGVVAVDHVVVTTPDRARTERALAAAGIERRRTRRAGETSQDFYVLDTAVLEVVGPAEPRPGDDAGAAAFWGLALVAEDIDALAARLGDRLSAPRDAVQPGRRFAAARPAAGLDTRVAFLSPRR